MGDDFGDSALFVFGYREKRKTRRATVIAAQVHGVFCSGDAELGDDDFGGSGEEELKVAGLLVLTALDQIVDFGAFFGEGGGEG